jgi:GDP-mannose 6-dehydrogenase
MKISIFGMGYVGAVSAACIAKDGHEVVGVDVDRKKLDFIAQGSSPVVEKGLEDLIKDSVDSKRLTVSSSVTEAVRNTQMSFVCVGTPSATNGQLDLTYVKRVSEQIGLVLREKSEPHLIVVRSTALPGTMNGTVIPILENASGKRAGQHFGVCYNPEFLREGTAVFDFYNPPKTLIGQMDDSSGDLLAALYEKLPAPIIRTELQIAEMCKYVDNTWHALKVTFSNEIGNICKLLGLDSHKVMEIFCQDTKLNISSKYLKPGFAFGGSCLPKDVRALTHKARMMSLELPILYSILRSNEMQIARAVQIVTKLAHRRVGILGLSFKAGTDDLRESPMVELVERLLGKGYDMRIYDNNVKMASLFGTNRDYILNHIPHISALLVDSLDEVLKHAKTVIIGNRTEEFFDISEKLSHDQVVVDLVHAINNEGRIGLYEGLCW